MPPVEPAVPARRLPPYVLVVDDQPMNLELARCLLELDGCEVGVAHDGEQARRSIARRHPHLVLLDIQMPVLDGLALLQELRADPATCKLRVVAFTAYAMADDEAKFLRAGFDGYLSKPLDVPSFAARVRALLEGGAAPALP